LPINVLLICGLSFEQIYRNSHPHIVGVS